MAKKPEELEKEAYEKAAAYSFALGMAFDAEKKSFMIGVFKWNYKTGEVKLVETKNAGDFKNLAVNNFKIMCLEKNII